MQRQSQVLRLIEPPRLTEDGSALKMVNDHESACYRCGRLGQLILCDKPKCTKAYHMKCIHKSKLPHGQFIYFIYLFSRLLSAAYKLANSPLHAWKDRECQYEMEEQSGNRQYKVVFSMLAVWRDSGETMCRFVKMLNVFQIADLVLTDAWVLYIA